MTETINLQHDGRNAVPDLCFWGAHMSQHFVSVPVVLKAPVVKNLKKNTDIEILLQQEHYILATQKCMPYFPLSFTASSYRPSAMAVVTSLV